VRRSRKRRRRRIVHRRALNASNDDGGEGVEVEQTKVLKTVMESKTPRECLGISTDLALTKQIIKKKFRERVKMVHPDVNSLFGARDALEKSVSAFEILIDLLNKNEGDFGVDDDDDDDDIYASLFVNEFKCVGVLKCPEYCCCCFTAKKWFSLNENTGAARFTNVIERPISKASESEKYKLHLAQQQCPKECITWLDKAQERACASELEKAIDGKENVNVIGERLEFMLIQFANENMLVEREISAAANKRERANGSSSSYKPNNSSPWFK